MIHAGRMGHGPPFHRLERESAFADPRFAGLGKPIPRAHHVHGSLSCSEPAVDAVLTASSSSHVAANSCQEQPRRTFYRCQVHAHDRHEVAQPSRIAPSFVVTTCVTANAHYNTRTAGHDSYEARPLLLLLQSMDPSTPASCSSEVGVPQSPFPLLSPTSVSVSVLPRATAFDLRVAQSRHLFLAI